MKIKNWDKHQRFKTKQPPWIKLHKCLIDDPEWHELDPVAAKILIMLWLLASEDKTMHGCLPPIKKIAFRLRMSEVLLNKELKKLGHWLDTSGTTEGQLKDNSGTPNVSLETETETETETEESSAKHSPKSARLSDEDFVKKLKNNIAYAGIDVDRELGKMDAWLATRPGRQKTRQFVVNWLNKIDKPLQEKEKPISDYDRKLKELKESRAKNAAAH